MNAQNFLAENIFLVEFNLFSPANSSSGSTKKVGFEGRGLGLFSPNQFTKRAHKGKYLFLEESGKNEREKSHSL